MTHFFAESREILETRCAFVNTPQKIREHFDPVGRANHKLSASKIMKIVRGSREEVDTANCEGAIWGK